MSELWRTFAVCSATMSLAALLYFAAAPLLARRFCARGLYFTWLIIILGFIIPLRPGWGWALFSTPAATAQTGIATYAGPAGITWLPNTTVNLALPMAQTAATITPGHIIGFIWLAGAALTLIYHLARHLRFTRLLKRWGTDITDEPTLALLQQLKVEMGLGGAPSLRRCPLAANPLLVGLFKPAILLPQRDFTTPELALILQHELIHYRHRDLWWRGLALCATALHWFNPVMYLVSRAAADACELACDEALLRGADAAARRCYGEAVLGTARYQAGFYTALATNFYGGKNSMKKRLALIMDSNGKRAGLAVVCAALIFCLASGAAFTARAAVPTTQIEESSVEYDPAERYAAYVAYGLIYDSAAAKLCFHGQPVRYFEDYYPIGDVGEGGYAGTDYFDEYGTVDAHGVRDLSQIVRHADGSYDPSGRLTGVEAYSQEEFAARDIERIKNPPQITAYGGGDSGGGIVTSNFSLGQESKQSFLVYAPFGLTYDDDEVFRYQGKTVRWFYDEGGTLAFTRAVANDYRQSVDILALRDAGGVLIGLQAASEAEFAARTARIEQSRKEQEEFFKTHGNVTAYSSDTGGGGAASYGNTASSHDSDYVDDSLSAYTDFGVSYDKIQKRWLFAQQPIAFLADPGHLYYVDDSNAEIVFESDPSHARYADESRAAAAPDATLLVLRDNVGQISEIKQLSLAEIERMINGW